MAICCGGLVFTYSASHLVAVYDMVRYPFFCKILIGGGILEQI